MNTVISDIIKSCPFLTPFQSALESLNSERYSIDVLGIPTTLLMENAGLEVSKLVLSCFKNMCTGLKNRAIIFAGPGNNGADALVVARHLLAHNISLTLCLLEKNTENLSPRNEQLLLLKKLINSSSHHVVNFLEDSDLINIDESFNTVIVDGIFGAGLSRAPEGKYLAAIKKINDIKSRLGKKVLVISIDVPSGCDLEATIPLGASVKADHTLTFGYLKRCHISEPSKKLMGNSKATDIGLFNDKSLDQYYIRHANSLLELLKPLYKNSHKGNFGHIAIVEGHRNYKGASRLAAKAALKAGAGLVTIITKGEESFHPSDLAEFMKRWHKDANEEFWRHISTLVLGPGLGSTPEMMSFAQEIISKTNNIVPTLVLDADGLKLLNTQKPLNFENLICTPHPKEAANILGVLAEDIEKNRFQAVESLGHLKINNGTNTIWVLKGSTTLVHQSGLGIFAFEGELPILSTGGSGDTLSGAIAGLMPQAISPMAATLLAINLQIQAALEALTQQSRGLLPSELSELFPSLLKRPAR